MVVITGASGDIGRANAQAFARRGVSGSLREALEQPGIQVCAVLLSVIDTPFFQHAANVGGRRVRAAPPVYITEEVAETVVGPVERP